MIRYKGQTEWITITPTIFPDGTSQVWKLPYFNSGGVHTIKWNFENEAELFHVLQLAQLLRELGSFVYLEMPYLPYARQDKNIKNESTFALSTFVTILEQSTLFRTITVYDAHNPSALPSKWINLKPVHFLKNIRETKPDVLFFPDQGALSRYSKLFVDDPEFNFRAKACGNKTRNQSTGEIEGYYISDPSNAIKGKDVMIIDDCCDGGATFIHAAEHLKAAGAEYITLSVSHGIFSKGKQPLYDAGISHIFCTNSLLHNEFGFEV